MKKVILFAAFCCLALMGNANAQHLGDITWRAESGWETGVTDVIPFDYYPGNSGDAVSDKPLHYIIAANSKAGTIKVFQLEEGAVMGRVTGELYGLKPGNWGITVFNVSGSAENNLFISYADAGIAEVYPLGGDGSISPKIWSADDWEKGVTEVAGLQNGLFALQPSGGVAWIYEIKPDGTIGLPVWFSSKWVKGQYDLTPFANNHLFLTMPNGRAWVYQFDGVNLELRWANVVYDKGIDVAAAGYFAYGSDYLLMGDPSHGKQFVLRYDEDAASAKVTWENRHWVKGLTRQALVYGGNHLFAVNNETGTAYIVKFGAPEL